MRMDVSIKSSLHSIAMSRGSMAAILKESWKSRSDDRKWSWTFLRSEFRRQDLETLFVKYRSRISNSTFAILLLLNIFICIVIITRASLTQISYSFQTLYFPVISLTFNFIFLIFMCNDNLLNSTKTMPLVCRILIYALMLLEEYGSTYLDCKHPGIHCCPLRIGYGLYLILALYLLIPMPNKICSIIGGLLVVVFELLISLQLLQLPWSAIAIDFALFILVNVYGIAWLFLEEITQRRVFLDLRSRITSKSELQTHKEHEEQLMLSVLPQYISVEVKLVICETVKKLDGERMIQRRPFNELFVKRHKNVSILFADIVKFTQLTAKLDASQLVETLNDLFGKFDDIAQENNCMRIKILGDCYYCVSGIPQEVDNHANNCVVTGLEMINIISEIREKRSVPELNMRIGINSGNVNSGILGLTKWQYDVWSKDVIFANYLEQTGRAGHVHIAKSTKEKLQNAYEYEPNPHTDQETFFIVQQKSQEAKKSTHFSRRASTAVKARLPFLKPTSEISKLKRRNTIIDTGFKNLKDQLTPAMVNKHLDEAMESMAVSKREQWMKQSDINALFLTFKSGNLEIPFLKDKDPLFKHYLMSSFILIVALFMITYWHFYPMTKHPVFVAFTGIYLVLGTMIIIIAWFKQIYEKWKGNLIQRHNMFFLWKSFYFLSEAIKQNLILRASLCLCGFFIMILWMTALSVAAMNYKIPRMNATLHIKTLDFNYTCNLWVKNHENILDLVTKISPRHITNSFVLIMMAVSFYLKTHYLLKLSLHVLSLFIFVMLMHFKWGKVANLLWESHYIHINQQNDWWSSNRLDHVLFLIQVLILFHVSDRQVEYLSRVGYLWNHKLREEQDEMKYTDTVNKVLLCNMLPLHVAEYYLRNDFIKDRLYHEEYTNISVMFASIPNFMDSYSENEITDDGVKCLQVLNEIIGRFDKLLFETQFKQIEKIKIIGSTYMAAAGLQPGKSSITEETEPCNFEFHVVMMTHFAIALMEQVEQMNENAMQEYRMRIGIDVGPVIAGVVGANKPLYDIWGNTVNIASRLDTSGVLGRIQVTKNTAEILTKNKFNCEYRGITTLKGVQKPVETYFVCTEFDETTYL